MHFHNQSVSTRSNRGHGQRRHQVRTTAGVAGIDNHRQMRMVPAERRQELLTALEK